MTSGAWVLVTSSLVCVSAHASPLLDQVSEVLEAHPVVQGNFEQISRTSALRTPLTSRGHFFIDRELGVVWRITSPVEAELAWPTAERAGTSKAPGLDWVVTVLGAAVRGDFGAIDRMFEITGTVADDAWHVELSPRSVAVQRVVRTIELRGARAIESVSVMQRNGDSSSITFSNIEYPDALAADVRAALSTNP